jgi:hypothetical protein
MPRTVRGADADRLERSCGLRGALGGRALPFVADPVQEPKPTVRPIFGLLADIDDPIDELSCTEIAVAVADCLLSLSDCPDRRRRPATPNITSPNRRSRGRSKLVPNGVHSLRSGRPLWLG